MSAPSICVVGSINLDMNAYVERFPRPGETLHGRRFTTGYGGKGANQAVMAARLGAKVSMVGRVGDDIFGQDMRRNLEREGVRTDFVRESKGVSSGVALITIDEHGQNQIIVIPGANGLVTSADVEEARDAIAGAQVLLCQMEVPMEANVAALRIARGAGATTIFNPAPVSSEVPEEVYRLSDIFCPNESEAELLTGVPVHTLDDARLAASILLERGARAALITLGAQGCLYVAADQEAHVPAPTVTAVDTTGAGDAFVGSLAHFLGAGLPALEAIARANAIAAISVQHPGTQASYPRWADLPENLR
ncbi:ribokinase [Caldilinea sp.]|jgi:ribokinase|uniref:ribokinase n=1 Tax=Caldilinea sp. TaxID=2293560 RepID=UPI0021DBFB61|nr:ribokinase [Caldilinea sp.]GIV68579.1 MAG: ribokinase [Caldilinea sp.]